MYINNMRLKCLYFIFLLIWLVGSCKLIATVPGKPEVEYINFPRAYEAWDYKFLAGVGITRLPTNIVEEEINTSPVLFGSFRLDIPWDISAELYLASNYISNIGTLSLQLNLINSYVSFAPGIRGSMWFGHLEMESIKLKSYGMLVKPYISIGIDFGDILFTGTFEVQFSNMYTFSEDSLLARFNQPRSSYTLRFTLEQPLFRNNWVLLGLGLNYATFYYQSWLSYSALRQYLLYPEMYFGFIL